MSKKFKKHFEPAIKNPLILLYGKRRSGKTYFMQKYIYKNHKKFTKIYIFKNTLTENAYNYKDKEIKTKIVQQKFNLETFKKQIKVLEYFKKMKKPYTFLFIFDDILDSMEKTEKSFFEKFSIQGRHINNGLTLFFLSQTLKNYITPTFRQNLDIIIFAKITHTDSNVVEKEFFKGNKKLFKQVRTEMNKVSYLKYVIDDIINESYFIL